MGAGLKRRLAISAVVVLVIAAAITGLVLATSGSSSSSQSTTQTSKEVYGVFGAFGITDGMRESQVLARLGPPDHKRNGCLVYRVHGQTFHGFNLHPQLTGVDAVRYCIYVGVVSVIEDHWHPVNGAPLVGYPWSAPMQYGCGGKPCQRQTP